MHNVNIQGNLKNVVVVCKLVELFKCLNKRETRWRFKFTL